MSPVEGHTVAAFELAIAMSLWIRHRSAWPIRAAITLSAAFAIAFLLMPDAERPCGCFGRFHVERAAHGVIVGAMGIVALLLESVARNARR